ncbi:MAG: hypothetical protein M0004_00845 [Actinomycetota bacterium]|nr:hypothetical protein [Actinomycetota bacterium]
MPMREECKHYQSRTYASGETARFCVLDLAPEAPWRCPEHCPRYAPRTADAGWVHGTLVEPALESEPGQPDEPPADIAAVLDEAENVVNAVGPEVRAEVERQHRVAEGPAWRRALRRLSRRGHDQDRRFGGHR